MFSILLWLVLLPAFLSGLQPALALCLLASNLFLCASVNALAHFVLFIPLNIVTLGTLVLGESQYNFHYFSLTWPGVLLNSACVLQFVHHFFTAGPRQQTNQLRIQYAFQCSLRPIIMACLAGPLSFVPQLIFGEYPPIIMAIWKIMCVCSGLTILQTVLFLPS